MKIFFAESRPDYASYTFNYGIYCVKETQSELPAIYNQGFLPYSGDSNLNYELFYLARSLRVDLDRFEDSSENRRVHRKTQELHIEMNLLEKSELLSSDSAFLSFAQDYVQARISTDHMSKARLNYILQLDIGSHIFQFKIDGKPVGYVLAVIEDSILHYWFSFFDVELMHSHALGKWMMWKVITWAKKNGLSQVYLGTCYGEKSLYKVRDHKGLSFYDGISWNPDVKLLKSWCKSDHENSWIDRLKQAPDKNDYLNQLK